MREFVHREITYELNEADPKVRLPRSGVQPYYKLQPVHTVPDVMPYNLMMAPGENSFVDVDIIQRLELAIDSRAREAVVVYDEKDNSTIGFDVRVKGDPMFLAPIILDEDYNAGVKHAALFLNLPVKPEGWQSAKTSLRHIEKKFTHREKFMLSKHSDLLLKFRNPGADFYETKYIVNQINKIYKNLSLDGITKVNRFDVFADKYEEYFNQAFNKGTHTKAVLEVEYQTLKLERNGWNRCLFLPFYLPVMIVFLLMLFVAVPLLVKYKHYKCTFLALYFAITLFELIVWGVLIF